MAQPWWQHHKHGRVYLSLHCKSLKTNSLRKYSYKQSLNVCNSHYNASFIYSAICASRTQGSISTGNGWPYNALRYLPLAYANKPPLPRLQAPLVVRMTPQATVALGLSRGNVANISCGITKWWIGQVYLQAKYTALLWTTSMKSCFHRMLKPVGQLCPAAKCNFDIHFAK